MNRPPGKQPAGFALPMTIIAVAGLTLLLIGLMTVLTLERKTARSYSDSARADLAVESGLANALGLITEIAVRDDSLVFRLEDPIQPTVPADDRPLGFREQFFTYGAVFENGAWRGIPLFSGASGASLGNGQINAQTLSTALASYVADATPIGRTGEHGQNIPRAKWVEVPSSDPKGYTMRYAFWVEDLSGRVDGRTLSKTPRGNGITTDELDASTIIDPTVDSGNFPASLIAGRDAIRTSATVRQLLTADQAKRIEPYIRYIPSPEKAPPPVIPQGFAYADAGMAAPDLNAFVEDKDVDAIADHIEKNLPLFKNRKGGFPASEDYVKTIAASIIDQADADGDATTGPGYRGVDSYPFVNELFDRYEWIAGASGTISIKVETFLELWNPSQQSISGSMEFTNVNRHTIKIPLTGETKFSEVRLPAQNVSIPPNGFAVIAAGERIYTFPEGAFPPSQLEFIDPTKANDSAVSENTFLLRWNGNLVDTARGGLQRTDGTLTAGFSNRKWKGNGSPAHDTSIGQPGDPRASHYINTKVFANTYSENSNWGGRALKKSIGVNTPYREVRLEKWADRGSNSTPGVDAGSDARVPTATQIILRSTGAPIAGKNYPANQPQYAPAFISNAGSLTSTAELGHIFDPAQWNNVESASGTASQRAGGGFSLAIGRPEFAVFDKDGMRAAQLLDLFSLASASDLSGRININTAPREVLRTIFAGVTLGDDPLAPGVKPKKTKDIGDIFADHVIAQRTGSPLRGLSDLNNIRKNPLVPRDPAKPADTPFFGNPDLFDSVPVIANPATQTIEWDDAGREELFRKTMNMAGFTSKSFRIVVAGEALSADGKTLGRSAREFHYSIEPTRDANGLPIAGGTPILTKHYEKSL